MGADVPPPVELAASPGPSTADRIRVRTDVYDAEIDPGSGSLVRLALLKYPISLEEPDAPFHLLTNDFRDGNGLFIADSPLFGNPEPNKSISFRSGGQREYILQEEGQETLEIPLIWSGPNGVEIRKVYTFRRGSYVVDVAYHIRNGGSVPWSGRLHGRLWRTPVEESGGIFRTYTYTGAVFSTAKDPYEKVDFSEIAKRAQQRARDPEWQGKPDQSATGGWAAMIQHYFAVAWLPDPTATNHYYTLYEAHGEAGGRPRYAAALYTDKLLAPGETGTIRLKAYIGPKIQHLMEEAAPRLELTVDYGWLTIIAQPLFWLLDKIHRFVHNWGWSIIILTILIKLAFFKLSAASYKSMARMRKLQPRLVTLRERYAGDKARLNQAMMEMYKEEKINPLGGCLPILVQIPVFIALYWVLLESVELRQAGFIFWLTDLSVYDPYFVLPILMGLTMLVQQRLNPMPPDPIQAKVMMALPFVFTFFFLFFPSGLVLYWFVNNLLSIAQQWVITKRIAPDVK